MHEADIMLALISKMDQILKIYENLEGGGRIDEIRFFPRLCVVTPCPMCHFNLDAMQKDVESTFDIDINLPILHITQVMGLSFGLNPKELGLKMNSVSPMKLLSNLHNAV
jgi:hypothetical protein